MSLTNAAHTPPLTCFPETTVYEACVKMSERNLSAIAVITPDERPVGILSEREVVKRVLLPGLDPRTTSVREVMSSPCMVIPVDRTPQDAMQVLLNRNAFYLGVVDEDRKLLGVVSYRTLLAQQVENLNAEVDHLTAYMGYDGGGD